MDTLAPLSMKSVARYENVVWIAELNESRNTLTHIAPFWSKGRAVLSESRQYK